LKFLKRGVTIWLVNPSSIHFRHRTVPSNKKGWAVRKRILVIDDDSEVRSMMRDVLTRHSYEVVCAANGIQAIEKSNEENLDLVLLDIRMPFFSGFWFCDAFKQKKDTRDIPVVMLSGLSDEDEEEAQKAYRVGASAYLKKPLHATELLKVVEEILR